MINSSSKRLKLKYSMNKDLGVLITYSQIVAMGNETLIKMLVNLKAHYLAIEAAKMFDMGPKIITEVFIDWAYTCMELLSGGNEQQSALAEKIYERFLSLQNHKQSKINEIALTQIADKAAKIDKKVIAKKLLDKETSMTKKIPVLLYMKEYQKSLEEAFLGKDTNMINMILIKFFSAASEEERLFLYQKIIKISPELVSQLVSFLRKTGNKKFLDELFAVTRNDPAIYFEIVNNVGEGPQSYIVLNNEARVADILRTKLLEIKKYKELSDAQKDSATSAILENEIKVIDYCLKDRATLETPVHEFKVNYTHPVQIGRGYLY
jgi:Vps16, C-terminal region